MFGYPDLDAGLNTSRFLKVIAFPKPMRHSTLNNGDSGLETIEISRICLKESIRQMFGYPDLDAGLNTSRFLKVIAFPKPMRHSTLNNGDSGLETMAIIIVIVLTTIPERQNISVSNCSLLLSFHRSFFGSRFNAPSISL